MRIKPSFTTVTVHNTAAVTDFATEQLQLTTHVILLVNTQDEHDHHLHLEHTHTWLTRRDVCHSQSTVQHIVVYTQGSHSNVRIKNHNFFQDSSGPCDSKKIRTISVPYMDKLKGKQDTIMPGFTRNTSCNTWQLHDLLTEIAAWY